MNQHTSTRSWPFSSLLALVGFVFVPALVMVSGLSTSGDRPRDEVENSPDRLAYSEGRDRLLSGIDRWVEARVPGRELALEFDRTTTRFLDDNYTGAVAANDRVQLGSDGWLFLRDATQQPCVTAAQEQEWAAEIRRVVGLLTAVDKQPLIAIAPDRSIVVPELLGDIPNDCQVRNREVVQRLAESDAVLDLAEGVSGEANALQIDTHWSPAGAMAGIKPVVEAIQPGTWEERQLTSHVVERRGDLDSLVGYENTESVNLLTIEQPTLTKLASFPTSIQGRPLVQATTPGAGERRVLLVHDSYGGYTPADDPTTYMTGLGAFYLRPWFSRVDNVRLGGTSAFSIADEPVRRSLEEADTVAVLFVMRALPIRLRTGGLSTPLATALVGRLGSTVEPTEVIPHEGVLVLDGFDGPSEEVEVFADQGAIRDRVNYSDRVSVLVEEGTQLRFSSDPRSAQLVTVD
jgi:hypothetical protein